MKDKIIVYGKSGGLATIATFLGNQWWVTSKDERLEPLYDESPYGETDYRYLCEKDEMMQFRDLAGMMGCALELPEDDIKVVLNNRLKDLNMMGVKFISSVQCSATRRPSDRDSSAYGVMTQIVVSRSSTSMASMTPRRHSAGPGCTWISS